MDKIDILNREEFVVKLVTLVETISSSNSSVCFAIDGKWGTGKTFVLDMFQEQLERIQSEETAKEKYFVIRYDCWKFDYYEEPLIAIVSSMISVIEEKTKLFPDSEAKQKLLGTLKAAGVALLSIGNAALKEKIGVDVQKAYDQLRNGWQDGEKAYLDDHSYDVYFSFNKVVEGLSELLKNLAEEYTIVFLVDELDRCLPEYAVKVLERLHHLTEGDTNILTVISIDKEQLMSSITQLFGFKDPAKYLEKFINFDVKLDCGVLSEKFSEKYSDYLTLFDKDLFPLDDSVDEYIQAIFKDIDVRTQEQVMKKVSLVHCMLYSDTKDYFFLCMELLLGVLICIYHDQSMFNDLNFTVSSSFDHIFDIPEKKMSPPFSHFFKEKLDEIQFRVSDNIPNQKAYVLPALNPGQPASLYGAILFSWYWLHSKHGGILIQHVRGDGYEPVSNSTDLLKKFAETLNVID